MLDLKLAASKMLADCRSSPVQYGLCSEQQFAAELTSAVVLQPLRRSEGLVLLKRRGEE